LLQITVMKQVFAVIAKRPLRGFSKTRLARELGEEAALKLYNSFIQDFFSSLAQNLGGKKLYLFVTPAGEGTQNYFREVIKRFSISNFCILLQKERPFFARIMALFAEIHAREGEAFVHLTGTDIPDFPFHFLQDPDPEELEVMIGPDRDGGFYYLGTLAGNYALFDLGTGLVERGEQGVLQAINARCRELGLRPHQLPEWSDVDTLEDLEICLERSGPSVIPNTHELGAEYIDD